MCLFTLAENHSQVIHRLPSTLIGLNDFCILFSQKFIYLACGVRKEEAEKEEAEEETDIALATEDSEILTEVLQRKILETAQKLFEFDQGKIVWHSCIIVNSRCMSNLIIVNCHGNLSLEMLDCDCEEEKFKAWCLKIWNKII